MDETELTFEAVPMPRGRVVARWERSRRRSWLRAGMFTIDAHEDGGAMVLADDRFGSRFMVGTSFFGPKEKATGEAVEYIRSLIEPFGGELVVEGEP